MKPANKNDKQAVTAEDHRETGWDWDLGFMVLGSPSPKP